jgi:uncharacterized Tic20 family protein
MFSEFQAPSPTQDERNWAMFAHLTALLTALVGAYTGGVGAALALLVPLGMYVYFGGRSRYVAYHALQATAFQAIGGVAWVGLTILVGGMLVGGWTLTLALSLVLVGLLFAPFMLAATLLAVISVLGMLAALVVYPLRGAYLTYEGLRFEYPWVGALAARAMTAAPPASA